VILGVTSVSAILALGLPNPVAILVAGICLGAALRDVGIAFRTARLWPIHKELFDWQKIEALVKDGADSQGTPNTA